MKLHKQYAQLGSKFSNQTRPEKIKHPKVVLWNTALANALGFEFETNQVGSYFSGQLLLPGSKPVALAYAGHQFGHFNPQLGDGRAHLLGEVIDQQGKLHDIQLKGSGPTLFSRNGDGKCGIKPAVREYLMSEAMAAMGVPTTRCLAVVATGETIYRQTSTPGAVVTRVASSHLRVGTFEYFAARQMYAEIKTLADLSIARHCPQIENDDPDKYIKLFSYVVDKQINLITEWMRVGFIHGVMNTDNTLLSGDTIDYGPCAMMGVYDPDTVFSSIDRNGRYAFGNQANIAQWNLARLAECLLPLIDTDEQRAIDKVMPLLTAFPDKFKQSNNHMMASKLGFEQSNEAVNNSQQALLELLLQHQLDYTQSFVQLQHSLGSDLDAKSQSLNPNLQQWQQNWVQLLQQTNTPLAQAQQLMSQHNPLVIPRNHHMEKVLDEVESDLHTDSLAVFLSVLQSPYTLTKHTHLYQDAAADDDLNYQTFCGT